MFYSQDILQKRGGRFGIVWIAATCGKSLKRRDFSSVNVVKTCDDIMDFIFLRAAPKRPGDARPRLSLYLSSQLMYGLTKVYSKQREYLLMDVSMVSTKCRVATAPMADIDLRAFPRYDTVTNPDYAALSSREGPNFDPTFGIFTTDSPFKVDIIPEMEMWKIQPSPEVLLSPFGSPLRQELSVHATFKPVPDSPHTVSSAEITMIEEPEHFVTDRQVSGDEELPMLNGEELQLLIRDTGLDEPLLDVIQDTGLDERLLDVLLSPTRHAVSTPIQSSLTDAALRDVLPVLEETPIGEAQLGTIVQPPARVRRGQPPSPGVTPQVPQQKRSHKRKRESLAMELSPNVTPSPQTRRRKRRLLFTDHETQISKTIVRENMKMGKSTCRPFELPVVESMTVSQMFSRPARKELRHPALVHLWTRNASALPYTEADSDWDHPIWTVPDLSVDRSTTSEEELRRAEPEPVEVAQDTTGLSIELGREASVTMERSRRLDDTPLAISAERSLGESREKSHTSLLEDAPVSKRPKVSVGTSSEDELTDFQMEQLELELSEFSRSLPRLGEQLYAHPELLEEEPLPETRPHTDTHTDIEKELIKSVTAQTMLEAWTTFRSICPLHTLRPKVAKLFTKLLDFCAVGKLRCKQKKAYADIYVCRGNSW